MKTFIVNVNGCLKLPQCEPFFYENICNNQITLLDEISNTSELDKIYDQLLAKINQHPFEFKEGAVIVFIPRDFSSPLKVCDYELYNDINVYKHLSSKLHYPLRFFTFYVDKTNSLQHSDATYSELKKVSDRVSALDEPCLKSYFPTYPEECSVEGNYKAYLEEELSRLNVCTRDFFQSILEPMPIVEETKVMFQNGINNFIGGCKGALSKIEHVYQPIIRDDVSEDIEKLVRVIFYIKELAKDTVKINDIPKYETFQPDYQHVKRLISTYTKRLNMWCVQKSYINTKEKCTKVKYLGSTKANMEYGEKVDKLIIEQLKNIEKDSNNKDVSVEETFANLNEVINTANEELILFAEKQTKEMFDESNYVTSGEEEFDLMEVSFEDKRREDELLGKMNVYSEHHVSSFAQENKAVQKLNLIKKQAEQVVEKLKVLKKSAFIISYVVGVLTVILFYLATQYSVLLKVSAWLFFAIYCAVVCVTFTSAYLIVRRKYVLQITELLMEGNRLTKDYLISFKNVAYEFENNLISAIEYRCFERTAAQKRAMQKKYNDQHARYEWHKKKVGDILKNLEYFSSFVAGEQPYDEKQISLETYEHDDCHTAFYHMRVF